MEKKLKALFDYQKFEKNSKLQNLISETHRRVRSSALSDDLMSKVSAAGTWEASYETVKEEHN